MSAAHIRTDVLVVGGGLAALRAAIEARSAGARVVVAVKGKLGRSGCSAMTTAGYAAVLSHPANGDSCETHSGDTRRGGADVGEPRLVELFCREAEQEVRYLERLGAQFKKDHGSYHRSPSGDHSHARVLVTTNDIGTDLTLPLLEEAKRLGVERLEPVIVVELLRDDAGICGAVCIDLRDDRSVTVSAASTVVATGGAGRLFSITSNPNDVTGDGYAIAARAGADLRDMEFIQFYPWRCIDPFPHSRVSLQPSTFVLGARLYNRDGERFMERFNPDGAEITTRDVAARGIFDQMRQGLGVGAGVRADLSAISTQDFQRSNPKLARRLGAMKIDHRTYAFVVGPEAHYFMGGLAIDEFGAGTIDGLFAAGESAGGIHGANRINSNALPEAQVFGARAGRAAAERRRVVAADALFEGAVRKWRKRLAGNGGAEPITKIDLQEQHQALRERMWQSLGIIRSADTMRLGLDYVERLREQIAARSPRDAQALRGWLELQSLCDVAELCLTSALARRESRGAHFREDFPKRDDDSWRGSVIAQRRPDGGVAVSFRSRP